MEDKTFELLEKLYIEMQDMRSTMATKDDIAQINTNMAKMEHNMVKMEHSLGSKIDILFDGYKANTEAIYELKTEVSDLKKQVQTHEIKLRVVK